MRIDPFKTKRLNPPLKPAAAPSDSPAPDPAAPAPDSSSEVGPHPLKTSNGLALAPRPALLRPLKFYPGCFSCGFDDYLARPELGRSTLDKIKDSPQRLRFYLEHGEADKPHFLRGRALHRLLLEPEQFWEKTTVWTGGSKTKGSGAKLRWQAFKAHAEAEGKEVISEGLDRWLRDLQELFRHHPLTRNLLAGAATEAVAFFERDGVQCKARADILNGRTITDVKSTHNLRKFMSAKNVYDFGYHRQGDWYSDGFSKALGSKIEVFQLLVIELPSEEDLKRDVLPPVDFALVKFDAEVLEDGREENDRNLSYYKRCKETNKWPGFAPAAPCVVSRPAWRS